MSEALATQEQTNPFAVQKEKAPKTIKGLLEGEAFKQAVAKALPQHCTADRFVRTALTAIMRTPKLSQCDQASFFQALMNLSQWGLEPDGRRAHLIPFENRKRGCTEVQLIIDYKGYVELAYRSGKVSFIHADVVCENDEFEYDKGELKKHKVNFKQPRGKMYAAYALCRFKDGTEKCEVMEKEKIDGIRARSRAGNSGPWVTDYDEMAKKTVFRRLTKWLELSAEFRDALDADGDKLEDLRLENMKPASVAPEGLDLPALPEETESSEQPAETVEAAKQEPPAADKPAGAPEVTVFDQVFDALKESGIKEEELMALCRSKGLAKDTQTSIKQLSTAKVKDILQGWGIIEAEILKGRAK